MNEQTIAAAAAFAAARETYPTARLILLLDRRPGFEREVMLAVPESSDWHTLFPPEQVCEISLREPEAAAAACDLLQAVALEPDTVMLEASTSTPSHARS